ncbi:MAG: hypothetical protein HOC24_03300 [Deltaproteobacteria bacterium]|jgi:hypothetical protein|nr:hypothetical protein [Deltaproteobacteria bacterium]
MPNVFKARCHCGSRATIIRSEVLGKDTLLTARCDNIACQRIFRTTLHEHDELQSSIKELRSAVLRA